MPYTNKNTSNTTEDKNTKKSRTYFHCGPQHKTSGPDKTQRIFQIKKNNWNGLDHEKTKPVRLLCAILSVMYKDAPQTAGTFL